MPFLQQSRRETTELCRNVQRKAEASPFLLLLTEKTYRSCQSSPQEQELGFAEVLMGSHLCAEDFFPLVIPGKQTPLSLTSFPHSFAVSRWWRLIPVALVWLSKGWITLACNQPKNNRWWEFWNGSQRSSKPHLTVSAAHHMGQGNLHHVACENGATASLAFRESHAEVHLKIATCWISSDSLRRKMGSASHCGWTPWSFPASASCRIFGK